MVGKYLNHFNAVDYVEPTGSLFFTGVSNNHLYIDEEIGGVETPAELYHLVNQMLERQEALNLNFNEHFKSA